MRFVNILQLGLKELRGLARNPMLIVLIAYAFTLAIYTPRRCPKPSTGLRSRLSTKTNRRYPRAS
ncbi:hypothetical protein GCM10010869_07750 [Mesorhizobium tianshanense]|uniref:ABC-2 type transport system permease protein n=1 Tax=Mesorhizobium tianshanense TaxID=39844 RepID=A0A562MZH7_9HYPH|nr:ABC-2 type transport system permease protein [Mesorhizobium tianshanense]GLS35187.1 hypothetical protein GCM10010869_07750 [Mesorhizobium tianshanense]